MAGRSGDASPARASGPGYEPAWAISPGTLRRTGDQPTSRTCRRAAHEPGARSRPAAGTGTGRRRASQNTGGAGANQGFARGNQSIGDHGEETGPNLWNQPIAIAGRRAKARCHRDNQLTGSAGTEIDQEPGIQASDGAGGGFRRGHGNESVGLQDHLRAQYI